MKRDHYIAIDWSQANMAIARLGKDSDKPIVIDVPASIEGVKVYLSKLKGNKVLTFEETTTAQWLYTELKDYVEEIIVCDPCRNRLLSEGPKTDKIDAIKLVTLLKNDLLKPVYHTGEQYFQLRKLISGYGDLVKSGVRIKNQRKAIYRASNVQGRTEELSGDYAQFVVDGQDRAIAHYAEEKARYEKEFARVARKYKEIKLIKAIPGIGDINAVKIVGIVVNAKRFKNKSAWLSYCGLVKLDRVSGGRSYGRKKSRYNRVIKGAFKTAAHIAIHTGNSNIFREYYEMLIREQGYAEHNARHATARRIAIVVLGMLKSGQKFENRWETKTKSAV